MSEHAIYAVMRSMPVDRLAWRVTKQSACADVDSPLSREELTEMLARMERKARLLKRVLNIETKKQQKNFRLAMKTTLPGNGKWRARANPRSAVEYIRLGEEIQRLGQRICALKKQREEA